ncbi:hypothetical protein E4T56_gene6535, partial [Termitomyces sp. T112]
AAHRQIAGQSADHIAFRIQIDRIHRLAGQQLPQLAQEQVIAVEDLRVLRLDPLAVTLGGHQGGNARAGGNGATGVIGHGQNGKARPMAAHQIERVANGGGNGKNSGIGAHHIACTLGINVAAGGNRAADVAIDNQPGQKPALHHTGSPHAAHRNRGNHLGQTGIGRHAGQICPLAHDPADRLRPLTQRPGGMAAQEIITGKVPKLAGRHGHRIAHRHLQGRAGGGRHAQMIGLTRDGQQNQRIDRARQRRIRPPDHADQMAAPLTQARQDAHQFNRGAAVGKQHDHTARRHRAQIAMAGVPGRQREGRRAKAGKRGRDLGRHQPRFADPAAQHRQARSGHRLNRLGQAFGRMGVAIGQSDHFAAQHFQRPFIGRRLRIEIGIHILKILSLTNVAQQQIQIHRIRAQQARRQMPSEPAPRAIPVRRGQFVHVPRRAQPWCHRPLPGMQHRLSGKGGQRPCLRQIGEDRARLRDHRGRIDADLAQPVRHLRHKSIERRAIDMQPVERMIADLDPPVLRQPVQQGTQKGYAIAMGGVLEKKVFLMLIG